MHIVTFKDRGINFDIETTDITEQELIALLESIINGIENITNMKDEIDYNLYTKIVDANLKADGIHTDILVRYNNTLFGKSNAMIDYMNNSKGPIGKIDKLIDSEYILKLNGETNCEEIWNAEIDYVGEKSIVLKYNNEYVLFTKIEEK